jgi:hypothetical protein
MISEIGTQETRLSSEGRLRGGLKSVVVTLTLATAITPTAPVCSDRQCDRRPVAESSSRKAARCLGYRMRNHRGCLRWREPRPATGLTRDATRSAQAAQYGQHCRSSGGHLQRGLFVRECLTPEAQSIADFGDVWIHGGGNRDEGARSNLAGEHLARREWYW